MSRKQYEQIQNALHQINTMDRQQEGGLEKVPSSGEDKLNDQGKVQQYP